MNWFFGSRLLFQFAILALHASASHVSRVFHWMTATSQKMFAVAMMLFVAGCLGSSCHPQDSKVSEDTLSMLSLQTARANMTRTGWANDATSDGKCKQWGSASHDNKIKFVGPWKAVSRTGPCEVFSISLHDHREPTSPGGVCDAGQRQDRTYVSRRPKKQQAAIGGFHGRHRFRQRGGYRT